MTPVHQLALLIGQQPNIQNLAWPSLVDDNTNGVHAIVSRKRCDCRDYPQCLKRTTYPGNHIGRTTAVAAEIRTDLFTIISGDDPNKPSGVARWATPKREQLQGS